jgi:DNA-binding CsgD family transcriptional regulator
VPDAVEDLLGTRVARLDDAPRRLLLATALSPDLHRDEVIALEGASVVEDAVDTGLLRLDGPHVRPSHPLLAAAARKRSRARERRALHRALADVVADEQLRARHLALAADRPDEQLAQTMSAAAQAASARGARHQAVVLAEHASRLTPAPSPSRDARLLKLGWYLMQAGELQRLTDLLTPAVESLPAGVLRARGFLLLADGAGPRTIDECEQLLDLGLAEAPDEPSVRSYVLAEKAGNQAASRLARLPEAEAWALEALEAAGEDRDFERAARYALAWTRALGGHAVDDLCSLSSVESNAATYIVASPERIAGQRHVWRGELEPGRALLERLLTLADERGEAASYALVRLHLCELELRAGEWAAAARRLDEWAQSADGELLIRPMYERCRALHAAGLGDAVAADRWAADAVARAETVGSRWDWLESERARGMAALLAREPARAVSYLRPAWEQLVRGGIGDPGTFPVAPELVEALMDAGEPEEARAVAARVDAPDHPWAAATALRCRALVEPGAGVGLAAAADAYGRLGLRFDRARCLLSLGRAQRRSKQWGAAREALEGGAAAFDALGSDGWAEVARGDLARVGGRRPRASGELTPTEQAVVDLAAEGQANKEIARALQLAVHTVEVHLSRAYRKLGVRSRSQLVKHLSSKLSDV